MPLSCQGACTNCCPNPLAGRYDIGATSGALVSMTSQQWSGTDWYSLSAFQSGLVVSLSLAGALLGSGAWCVVQPTMVHG